MQARYRHDTVTTRNYAAYILFCFVLFWLNSRLDIQTFYRFPSGSGGNLYDSMFTLKVRCLPQRPFQSVFCNYTKCARSSKAQSKCNGKHVYPSPLFHFLYSLRTSTSPSMFSVKTINNILSWLINWYSFRVKSLWIQVKISVV